jgi:hypothetical protein
MAFESSSSAAESRAGTVAELEVGCRLRGDRLDAHDLRLVEIGRKLDDLGRDLSELSNDLRQMAGKVDRLAASLNATILHLAPEVPNGH